MQNRLMRVRFVHVSSTSKVAYSGPTWADYDGFARDILTANNHAYPTLISVRYAVVKLWITSLYFFPYIYIQFIYIYICVEIATCHK